MSLRDSPRESASSGSETTIDRRGFVRLGAGAAAATAGIAVGAGSAAANYDGWLEGVSNYEGTVDMTGQDEVTVSVGAGNGLLFDPPAILVDPGTTVVWEWTGQGGQHNVAEADGAFESELVQEGGHTFEQTFESEGTFRYQCDPHEAVGMKGVVAVGSTDDDLIEPSGGGSGGDGGGSGGDGGDGGSGEGSGSGDGSGDGSSEDTPAPASGGVTLSGSDLFAIATSFGFVAVLFALVFGDIDAEE
ncbi:halocyanin domain-containing protein [Halopenitus persicus]|uniref:Halocyanin domain-containing protein n=1 Tax=Halopenitus persicus TaxID=1048396 RepID=A0A1H3DK97_9EURY|nr:halocyanin domain-containing protein [Halopenitus persicus]QHS16262.1 halocyanin domain-containing protein [haloarchaeon 3A1-DGR]SDX66069.1 halocyanin domain-containing protein [Halopenitus persicus]